MLVWHNWNSKCIMCMFTFCKNLFAFLVHSAISMCWDCLYLMQLIIVLEDLFPYASSMIFVSMLFFIVLVQFGVWFVVYVVKLMSFFVIFQKVNFLIIWCSYMSNSTFRYKQNPKVISLSKKTITDIQVNLSKYGLKFTVIPQNSSFCNMKNEIIEFCWKLRLA